MFPRRCCGQTAQIELSVLSPFKEKKLGSESTIEAEVGTLGPTSQLEDHIDNTVNLLDLYRSHLDGPQI